MTMRWIWLVPSYIWVIVERRAVPAGRRRAAGCGVSTDPARHCPANGCEPLAVLRLVLTGSRP
jgi:hypothetical protein